MAVSRQQQFPGNGNPFGNFGNAFGNAFNAIFTNSANQLTNSVNRPLNSPVNPAFGSGFQRPPGFFAAVRPVPVPGRPDTLTPVNRPTGTPISPVNRPTAGTPLTPVNRPTGTPLTPVNRPTGTAGRKRRTATVEKAVDTTVAYKTDVPTPATTEAPSSYWPVPGAGWFYG